MCVYGCDVGTAVFRREYGISNAETPEDYDLSSSSNSNIATKIKYKKLNK